MEVFYIPYSVSQNDSILQPIILYQKSRCSHWYRQNEYNLIIKDLSFLLFFFFHWKLIALQLCVGFCKTTMQIRREYCFPLEPPLLPPISSLLSLTEHRAGVPVLYSRFPLVIYFTHDSVYMSMLLSELILPSPSPSVSTKMSSMTV